MQFVTTGLLIIAFIVLLLIFFSCNKKGTKTLEPFVNEMRLAEYILPYDTMRTDLEITSKEMDIEEKTDDIYALLIAISNIETAIENKQTQLDQLRLDYANLNLDFDNILRLINELNQYIASFVNTDTPYVQGIDVFNLQVVRDRRNTIASDIDSIKDRLASQLVHYGQEDISSVEKINSTIASFNEIKQTYDTVYSILKKNTAFMEVCSGCNINNLDYPDYVRTFINEEFDASICTELVNNINVNQLQPSLNDNNHFFNAENNYRIGESICQGKTGSCFYETTKYFPKSYHMGTYSHVFHRDKWPLEDSCEAQSNECYPFDQSSFCTDVDIDLWFTKQDNPAAYYTSNVGYRSRLLEHENEWVCDVDLPVHQQIMNETDIHNIAQNNCELQNRGFGKAAYNCWTVSDEKINNSNMLVTPDNKSKTWNQYYDNLDGSLGTCAINNICRTELDTENHVNCLAENYSSTGNFECYDLVDNDVVSTNRFRNSYDISTEWNYDTNELPVGACTTSVIENCRTKDDVEREKDCVTDANWKCASFNFQPHASNIGSVSVVESYPASWHKSYQPLDYININNTNKGAGSCDTNSSCLNPVLLNAEANCHNGDDNYRCWNVNANHSANQTENTTYKYYEDPECITRTDCYTMEHALSIAEENCHASGGDNRCYKLKDNSLELELDNEHINKEDEIIQFEEGRTTKFIEDSSTRSYCYTRSCQTKEDICGSNLVSCYDIKTDNEHIQDIHTYETGMIYDDASNICAIPNECKQIPPCSYQIVLTSNQSVFNVDDINGVDCSENGQYGSKYRWVLESSHSNSIYNPNDNLNNYDYWSPIDSSELNELCIRDEEMLTSHLSTVSESTESYICNCTDASYSTSMHYFISDYFSDNNGDGFETIEGICGSNDCGVKRYHQANVRLNACNGDRYKNVASNIGSSNCVNEEACRRKCLNTGQLDGDPVVVPYTDTAPITCYAPVTNEEINRFSYYGTDPNTCSSNVCSDTEYGNCSYQVLNANDGWGTKEIVLGTDNKNYRFIHNSVDGEIFNLGTGLSRNENENTINYDTRTEEQVGCPDSSDHTVSSNLYTKKSVYKYTRAIKQVDDDTCFPVSEKSQVKYTIEEDDTPCPKDCVYYWETDVSGYPVYGDCSSICKDTNDSVVKKTQKYVNRDGNSAGESTCPSPNSTELGLHTIYCDNIPLCCTPNDGIWGHYMYNNVSYGVDGVCPLCTFDGKSFDLTRTTTGKVTCHPITGVADTTKQSEDTKTCTPPPNTCGAEVPGTSSSSCSQPDGQPDGPCTLKADGSFTKPGTETKSYKVYSTTGQTDKSDFPQDCFINCINPSPPNGLTFTEKTANTITITWNTGDNGDTIVDGYDIFHNNSIHNSYLVKGNRYTLDNLYPNTSYQIKVQKKTDPIFANLFSNEIEVKTDLPDCGSDDYTDSFIHNGSTYTSLAAVPCVSNHCGDMNVTKMYTPDNCKGSKADETVTKDCGYCVSTTGSNKFFHILFHDTNDVIDTRGISDWKRTLKSQFRFLVSGDIAGYQMNVGKTPYEMETLSQYHKEFVTFELEQCYQCTGDKVIQVILTKDRGSVKSHSNGDLYLHGGGSKLAHHQNRVIIPYNGVMYVEHELERVIGFGDNSHKSAIYYIKETKGSTYAKVDRSNSNPNESSLTWVSYRASATQFVITNDGLLLQESGNVPKLGTNSWMKMLKTQGNTVMTQPHTTPLPPTGTSYVNSKPLSNVSGPIKLISVHVNADTKVSAKALVGSQEASYHFTQSLLDTMLDTRCINDEHEWDWSPRGTYNPNGMIDFGIEIANTGIINQTPDRRSDIIPNDIRARLNALPRAGIEKFKLEYDLSENAYYLYYDAGVDNSIFYLTMKNMIACFTKQKTRNALILLETVTLDTLSIREQPARIKAYKIKFKTSGLYLSGNSSRNNPFSVSISPFSPHFIIISLNDGVMYPSKF